MFDGPEGFALQKDLKEYLERPENQQILAEQQRDEFLHAQKMREKDLEMRFVSKLRALDPCKQKRLRPLLQHGVLRTLLMSVSNTSDQEFSAWLENPRVMQMFTEAERLLRKGHVSEKDMERALLGYLSGTKESGNEEELSFAQRIKSVGLPTKNLLQPLNEHLQERKKGNNAYKRHDFKTARNHYERSLAVLSIIRGCHSEDQKEIERCQREILLNLSAVAFSNEEYGACIQLCTEVLKKDTYNVKALQRRGMAHKRRHDMELAKADFQSVANIRQDDIKKT